MKSSLYLAVASAVLAAASPLGKRAEETEWVYDVVTVTVTAEAKPSEFVANTKPQPTSQAPAPPPPPPPAAAAVKEPETTQAPPPPPPPPKTTSVAPPPPPETKPAPPPKVEAPPKEPPKAPAPKPSQPSSGGTEKTHPAGSYQKTVLDQHNLHRRNHSSPDLQWSDQLAQYAKITAEKCVFAHDMNQGGGGYGQNIASYGSSSNSGSDSDNIARAITDEWYDSEYAAYANFFGTNPPTGNFGAYGHLTQVVWKDSQNVGCWTARCPAGSVLGMESAFSVCNYDPPGNFGGKYATNVLPPLGLSITIL